MNEFPEFMEPEIPQGVAGLIEVMKRIHEQPDSRIYEWRVVFVDLRKDDPGIIAGLIEKNLNAGFSAKNQLADIQDDFMFWAGARLRKPEGE